MYFEREKSKKVNKYTKFIICISLVLVVTFAFTIRLFHLQVVKYDYYKKDSMISSAADIKVEATRGEILDRYGRTIAYNREGYNVITEFIVNGNGSLSN